MQITTVLTKAEPRIVNKRDGSGSFTLYELFDHEGTPWVAKQDVFTQWARALGQTVDMIVRVEQNGQWTNRYVDFIQPSVNGQVPASNAVAQALQGAQQAQQIWTPGQPNPMITQPQVPMPSPGYPSVAQATAAALQIPSGPTEKDQAIHRQVAAKVAAQISNSAGEFWGNCLDLARYFDTGQTPMAGGNPTSPPPDQAQFAMAGSGYDNSPPPHGDDSVPF